MTHIVTDITQRQSRSLKTMHLPQPWQHTDALLGAREKCCKCIQSPRCLKSSCGGWSQASNQCLDNSFQSFKVKTTLRLETHRSGFLLWRNIKEPPRISISQSRFKSSPDPVQRGLLEGLQLQPVISLHETTLGGCCPFSGCWMRESPWRLIGGNKEPNIWPCNDWLLPPSIEALVSSYVWLNTPFWHFQSTCWASGWLPACLPTRAGLS